MDLETYAKTRNLSEEVRIQLRELQRLEREERRARQAQGIEQAKARGVRFGRPRTEVRGLEHVYALYATNQISVTEAAKLCGIPRSTMYRRLCECGRRGNRAG